MLCVKCFREVVSIFYHLQNAACIYKFYALTDFTGHFNYNMHKNFNILCILLNNFIIFFTFVFSWIVLERSK
jgi:hypothetical protein